MHLLEVGWLVSSAPPSLRPRLRDGALPDDARDV